jgi:cytochrome c oxidase subunit IV
MTSETREVAHNQHAHPTNWFYIKVGIWLFVLTVLEVIGYIAEVNHWVSPGFAATFILLLSAGKFVLVVMLYMHLKFDHKLFTGTFVFPALLGVLVIGSMILLFGPIHQTSTAKTDDDRQGPWVSEAVAEAVAGPEAATPTGRH